MTQPPSVGYTISGSTPTPRRFLFSKRPPGSQQRTSGNGANGFSGSQRFQSTPRFAPPTSTQRPPSTPVYPGTVRPLRHTDPIDDTLDSSPNDAPPSATRSVLGQNTQRVRDRTDIDIDIASDSQDEDEEAVPPPPTFAMNDSIEIESEPPSFPESSIEESLPKRRRISISPAPSWNEPAKDVARSPQEEPMVPKDDEEDEELPDVKEETSHAPDATPKDEVSGLAGLDSAGTSKTQPTFHRAPRFKVSETEATLQAGLPEAFSPQRRGAKYVAGGLAAELQTWLAEVKGWSGDRPADLVMTIIIDEVCSGNGMYLVRGRRVLKDGNEREEIAARLLLAGEGKLTGLGQRAPVDVGSTVAISQPAWEIVLEGVKWIVVCDWAIS
ncbi:hypothetical protein CCHL11_05772 [Colletotrichum chlorophyti]|uniref:Uncharacterized protein n=1 Tax=Colletotrichum chlorophyti TaxID=708187 RepID=A0A1Q8RMQ2_9PEZI|nr:hypothetical protein CCHL11_05772 [Colletotrichum chlorophyti]